MVTKKQHKNRFAEDLPDGSRGLDCQSFQEACCGCCLNMRLPRARLEKILRHNTVAARRVLNDGRLTVRRLVRWHWACGGFWDHLLMFWLAGPTLALSAWGWHRLFGCCAFAGFLSEEPLRVGCLVHPQRIQDGRDWRHWAFPFIPTLRCERDLRCGLLLNGDEESCAERDWFEVSRIAAATRREGRRCV